jgi:hypothetical protein
MNKLQSKIGLVYLLILYCLVACNIVLGQGGYNDDRVMIQGFMWESVQPHCQNKWYSYVKSQINELADAKFNLIWLPPLSYGAGAGYSPEELYDFNNNYGTAEEHGKLLQALLKAGPTKS